MESVKKNSLLLVGSIIAFVLMGAGQSLMGPALPEFRHIFTLSVASASMAVTAQWVGALLGVIALFFGGQRDWTRVAFGLLVVGAALMAWQINWPITLLGSLAFGAGYGASLALINSRLLQSFERAGPSMVSLVNALFGGGAIVAPLVFVALARNPKLCFGILAVGLILPFLLSFLFPPQRVAEKSTEKKRANHISLPTLLIGASGTAVEACLIGLGPVILVSAHFSDSAAASALSLFFAFFLGGRILLSFIGHRLPTAPMLIGGFFGSAVLLACAGSGIYPTLTYPVAGLFIGSIFPNFFVFGSNRMGKDAKTGSIIVTAALAGGVTGPLIVGQVVAAMPPLTPFWLLAGYSAVVALCALRVLRNPRNAEIAVQQN
ncbi:MFS transporter [Acerihabitans sp. TG2]|uniref:MFS transporter n=1 Tax=Acerihabitans sp. TG2 TaxID=3096008 RepID=UPI002B23190A|nr:MFS transporter [Acerihabitans sp. TG2]MEA9390151.1 MFS transporter [Acerihabitans sp. TG2]